MKHSSFLIIFFLLIFSGSAIGQNWDWWNNIHGWQEGMKGWRMWLIISPEYLGPNALPVPELKNGLIPEKGEFEFGTDFHFKPGDPTQDISGRILIPFANSRIALEIYGVIAEKYQMSETIRDERFARDKDGRGVTQGDFYFTTLIQLVKNRKFPNTMVRLACKTASGGKYDAARYSDSPGYFFDLNMSKELITKGGKIIRPVAMAGFYSWQTNDELNLQNDAILYGAGFEFQYKKWLISSSLTGYNGYKNNGDRPLIFNVGLKKEIRKTNFRLQYLHGLNDWEYNTVKVSLIWHFNGIS